MTSETTAPPIAPLDAPAPPPVPLFTEAEVLAVVTQAFQAGLRCAMEPIGASAESICRALVASIPEPDIPRPYMYEAFPLTLSENENR